jgi:two-component system cell cycle sensor histidine kinase PleC
MLFASDWIAAQPDMRLVALAGLIGLVSFYTAMTLHWRGRQHLSTIRVYWLTAAAIAFGWGVWAAYFVTTLALQPGSPAGSFWFAIPITALTLLISGAGFLGARVDMHVATLAAAKRELEHTTEQLRLALSAAAVGNQTKAQFLATMSHELRTPLNAIIGFSEILKEQLFGPLGNPRYTDYATAIAESGAHLLSLINDILDISKLDAGRLELNEEDVNVASILRTCARLVEPQVKRAKVRLSIDIEAHLPALRADERRLRQILLNLFSNAVKFTPEGGDVCVSTRMHDGGLIIVIADTGIGMAAEDIPTALERFGQIDSKLSRKYEGTGLGLPLSKQLMDLHGGGLEIVSEVSVGTTVTISFPPERVLRARRAA